MSSLAGCCPQTRRRLDNTWAVVAASPHPRHPVARRCCSVLAANHGRARRRMIAACLGTKAASPSRVMRATSRGACSRPCSSSVLIGRPTRPGVATGMEEADIAPLRLPRHQPPRWQVSTAQAPLEPQAAQWALAAPGGRLRQHRHRHCLWWYCHMAGRHHALGALSWSRQQLARCKALAIVHALASSPRSLGQRAQRSPLGRNRPAAWALAAYPAPPL
mmetsp:Transcript_51922/g.110987  ORF Transcript_51922/g.110987 Transcript_51922/m.110987 type:complete len:219 (-) Transcript_51922:120-776(-)